MLKAFSPVEPTAELRPGARPYAALPLGWAAVILLLTLTPADEMPHTPVWELLSFDTAAHAGVFALQAVLAWFSLRRQTRWPRLARHAGSVVLLGCTLFGGLIELLQHSMALGRQGDWTDWLSDIIGAGLGTGFMAAVVGLARHRARRRALLLLVGALAATQAPAQDLARARRTITQLAGPGLHGRGYVRDGDKKAAAYLRGRLRALKLEPLVPDFTQPFMLDVNTFPGVVKLQFKAGVKADAGLTLHAGPDFIAAPNSGSGVVKGALLLPLDTLIFTDSAAVRRLLRQPVRARVLLLRARDAHRLPALPPALRQHLDSAAGWVTLVPKLTASLADYQTAQPRLEVLASKWRYGPHPPPGLRVQCQVEAKLQRNYQAQNLAAVVRGRTQADSFLVVSAHYDHLGMMGKTAYFPGANDNASGVALLLELAAYYARPENRPACSVAFLLFGAEEAGLVGSRYFVQHPLLPLAGVKFLVNLDLLGTGEQGATVVNGRLLEAPYRRLVALNDAHHYLPALAPRGRAANSDHFPFSEVGVPAFFIYTRGGSTAYHDVNDLPAALSLAGFRGAFGLVRDFLNSYQ
jgi:aminopeptidase YwaD